MNYLWNAVFKLFVGLLWGAVWKPTKRSGKGNLYLAI